MSGAKVYVVWGGDREQEYGEHYADFRTLAAAERYVKKTRRANPRLLLHIHEEVER